MRCANLREEANGRVRLARIDAPERGQAGFEEAKQALVELVEGEEVTCELVDADPRRSGFQDRDPFGRPVARCYAGGVNLQERLLRIGLVEPWP